LRALVSTMTAVSTCPACQHQNSETAKYCEECGTFLRAAGSASTHDAGERRYLPVMFCDLVGSSSLTVGLGPEDYSEIQRMVYFAGTSIVLNYGGQVSQFLGDGILAVFGYPQAHEDDAARAVNAALEMQAAIPTCTPEIRKRLPRFSGMLQTRAAIDTGLVVIREIREGPQRGLHVSGEPAIIASRLQGLATPDALFITDATRRLIGERFELKPQGWFDIKEIRSVEAFRVIGSGPDSRRHDMARRGPLTQMVGREDQVGILRERWTEVVAGRGQLVLISGEAGIGKSRLVTAARQCLPAEGRWLELRGSEHRRSSELRPVLDLLEKHVLEGATGSDARQRLEREFDRNDLKSEAPRLLASLLSLPESQDQQPMTLLPGQQRQRILNALIEWVWRIAADSPVAIAVEDVQWVDPTTLDLLRSLAESIKDHKVFLLLTHRPDQDLTKLLWEPGPTELRFVLSALTRRDAQKLVESIAGDHTLPDDVMRDVLDKSEGIPLYLEEVTRMLVDSRAAMGSVPEGLVELLSARLDQVPAPALDTIRIGAVMGRHFSRELLLAVSLKDAEGVAADMNLLMQFGIMLPESDGYSFKHVLIQDVAYKRMLRGTQADLHRRIATILQERFPVLADAQPELVAHHLEGAGATEPAFRAWSRAGERSLGNGAYKEAAHQFNKALELHDALQYMSKEERTTHAQEELRLRRDLGIALIPTEGYTCKAVAENYERALRRSSALNASEDIPIHVLYGLWGTCLVRGDRKATDELARHFRRVRASKDQLARHVAYSTLGARAFYRGNFTYALKLCQQAMQLYEPEQHFSLMRDYGYEGPLYSHGYVACLLCFIGYPDRGLGVVNDALKLSETIGDPYTKAVSLGFAACVARERGEPWQAKTFSEQLVRLATDHEFPLYLGIAHCVRGWSTLSGGDIGGGMEEIRFGLTIWEKTGARLPGTYFRRNLIEAELAGGQIDAGLSEVERGLRQCRDSLESYQEPEYHRLKGELLKVCEDTQAAEREIKRALTGARKQGAAWVELRAALSLARLARQIGRTDDLVTPLVDVRSRITEGADTPEMLEAEALLAEV
jgi:class 3 adenylate cyclase/tetratricopeptide (TPR) repeat protein